MVAELVRHILRRLLCGRAAESGMNINYCVNSTLRVTPLLDPPSERTLTWCTSTSCRSDINMFTVPKQPIGFEGNKPEQQSGSMTTFKDWAAEVQIYMSLEDHNLVTVMNEARDQTAPINDARYIDHELHQQGLGYRDGKKMSDQKEQRLLQEHTAANAGAVRRNADRAGHRAGGETTDADEVLPPVPTLPDDYDPFTPDQREIITANTEAFHHCSRALQYTLTKVTKGEPHRFVLQCNHNNSSGFETWRRMHTIYDQGEKAQQLNLLSRIMKPTWNQVSQAPGKLIRQFQNWRDKIFNYESTVSTEIAPSVKMALVMQHIQGDIRSHLLLTENLATPNFEDAAKKVEEYYRNVYSDNNNGGVNGMKGKYYKGKD
eukprot:6226820-Amphidinium_carterae.1